jgi:ribosomal protein S18 acetylase RimI-like enzyme
MAEKWPKAPRQAVEADVPAVAAALAEAFLDYPWTRWTVDAANHQARLAALQRIAIEELAMDYGEVWVIEAAGQGVHSAAVWMSPHSPVPRAVVEEVSRRSAGLEGVFHERSVDAEQLIGPLRPTTPHYLLGAVGTVPTRRRLGLGEAVLRPVLDRAKEEGADAYLETSTNSNVGFYSRLGFEVIWYKTLESGGPEVWGMLRSGQPM